MALARRACRAGAIGCVLAVMLTACAAGPAVRTGSPTSSTTTTIHTPTSSSTSTSPPVQPPLFGQPPSNPAAFVGRPTGAACSPAGVSLTWGGQISEATGQNTLGLYLTNKSGATCHMVGYPGVSFIDSNGAPIPFVYRRGGDQMVTSKAPQIVNLPAGAIAYVELNKYRCDLGVKDLPTTLDLILPNTSASLTLPLTTPGQPGIPYCGPGDPGSIVDITPVEPTAQATSALA